MSDIDKIDDSVRKIDESSLISPISSGDSASSKVDSGLSSIEKSKHVIPELAISMSTPILMAPSGQESIAFVVASIDSSGRPDTQTIRSFILQGEDIKSSVLEGWRHNLGEIEDSVRQLLLSPFYLHLQELRRKEASGEAASIEGNTGAVNSFGSLQALEKLSPAKEATESASTADATQLIILPLTAAMMMGAGLSMGVEMIQATNPLGGIYEIVAKIQPLFLQKISVGDLIPLINLMVVAPIYYNSWNEAVSNLRSGERHTYVQTAQNFAKDVIKMVTDAHFIQALIASLGGTAQLSPEDKERLAVILKIVLIGVALSLIYSVEVGKVQGGRFAGIEPEELRELLLGKFHKKSEGAKTALEELSLSLIDRGREQLSLLSPKDREVAANMLLDYVHQNRELDPMLDPAKVFREALKSTTFRPTDYSPPAA